MTTPPEDEHDEDFTPAVPEPPRRVPFGVAVSTMFLALLATLLFVGAVATLTTSGLYRDTVGEAAAEGLGTALIAIAAVLTAATAWSFARNGNTIGPMIVGGLTLLAGLISLVQGVTTASDAEGVRIGVLALALGFGITLPALIGQSPLYLAARRVWAKAEKEWLRDLATPDGPVQPVYQPWQPPQQGQQPWAAYPQQQGQGAPWPGPHNQPAPPYGPPFPTQPHWPQPYPPQQVQPGPGPAWPAHTAQASTPPAPGPTAAPPSEAPQVAHSGPPHAAAQHAPTEQIRTAPPPDAPPAGS